MIRDHLRRPAGIALVAAKRYYFGVGGGTDAFTAALAATTPSGGGGGEEWEASEARTLADGKSNARLIMQVKFNHLSHSAGGATAGATDAGNSGGGCIADDGCSRGEDG